MTHAAAGSGSHLRSQPLAKRMNIAILKALVGDVHDVELARNLKSSPSTVLRLSEQRPFLLPCDQPVKR
jgi:hypothetical protein